MEGSVRDGTRLTLSRGIRLIPMMERSMKIIIIEKEDMVFCFFMFCSLSLNCHSWSLVCHSVVIRYIFIGFSYNIASSVSI